MKEYSVGSAYKFTAGMILILSPFFYFRFFVDILARWPTTLMAIRNHPISTAALLGIPILAVFVGLVILTYRFAVDLLFSRTVKGVLEDSTLIKGRLFGDRIRVQISGRCYDILNDLAVSELLFSKYSLGKSIEMRLGGLNKVLYLGVAKN